LLGYYVDIYMSVQRETARARSTPGAA